MKSFSTLAALLISLLLQAQAWAQNCPNCRRTTTVRAPVSTWTVPSSCKAPSLTDDKLNFTDPANKCSFYTCASNDPKGAKNVLGCQAGNDGNKVNYFIDYGYKYCNRFCTQTYSHLSTRGKKWMNKTLVCLQTALQKGCSRGKCSTCVATKDYAFVSHAPCYVGSGLCELPHSDMLKVGLTPDSKDLARQEGLLQAGQVAALCTKWMAENPGKAAGQFGQTFKEIFDYVF